MTEFPELAPEENQSEQRRDQQPQLPLFHVAPLHGSEREYHRETRHQQIEGAERRERNIQNLVWVWPHEAPALVDEIGGDQRAREQALRADERPERHLAAVEPHARAMRVRA